MRPDRAKGHRVKDADVVIVGGGIGGMTASLLFADIGAQVTLLERVDAPAAVGAGILLQPNGLAVLAALGLGDALERAGHRLRTSALRTTRGTTIADLTPVDTGRPWDHLLALRRSRLQQILIDAVAGRSGIATRFGAEVTSADADGRVELRWHDRVSTITADLVVGADGVGSAVRRSQGFGAHVRDTGTRYIRGLVDGADLHLEGEYWTRLGLFGGAPVGEATTYFYAAATAPPVATAVAARDLAALRRAWVDALPVVASVLDRVRGFDDLLINDVARVDCDRWVGGRSVLLGDAAHAMAPTLGQGANSAIVDAAVLTGELSADQTVSEALARYTSRRQRAVGRVQNHADRLTTMSAIGHPWLRALRDTGLHAAALLPGAAARVAGMVQQEEPAELHRTVAQRRLDQGAMR
jgi:2-polyprenyl-6-methoxyphenol hydroxylase-like FAD-dependent oxidoreductase